MPVKTCIVNFTGPDETVHQVEVSAESVYEATAMALRQFRHDTWSGEASHWTGLFEMTVKQPEVNHRVFLEKFNRFLEANGGKLRQRSLRDRVKKILNEK